MGSGPQAEIATIIKQQVADFKPVVPLVTALRNRGMADRHWQEISDKSGTTIDPQQDGFTLNKVLLLLLLLLCSCLVTWPRLVTSHTSAGPCKCCHSSIF